MRVERFSLFFPPLLLRKKVGETEYALGALPLGGYVKISGMNPDESLPDEVRTRAYHAQPVWKRIVVIAAGPLVNLVLALLLFVVFFWVIGATTQSDRVGQIEEGFLPPPRSAGRPPGGRRRRARQHRAALRGHLRAQVPRTPARRGCEASTPAVLTIERDGERMKLRLTPSTTP